MGVHGIGAAREHQARLIAARVDQHQHAGSAAIQVRIEDAIGARPRLRRHAQLHGQARQWAAQTITQKRDTNGLRYRKHEVILSQVRGFLRLPKYHRPA
jgi:hypothetical protein